LAENQKMTYGSTRSDPDPPPGEPGSSRAQFSNTHQTYFHNSYEKLNNNKYKYIIYNNLNKNYNRHKHQFTSRLNRHALFQKPESAVCGRKIIPESASGQAAPHPQDVGGADEALLDVCVTV
jgi:hypothetical protein